LAFLLRRFDVAGAYGLSFTITLAALFAGIWFFGSALEDLLAYNGTALLDVPVLNFLVTHRISWLTAVMRAMNVLGSGCALIVVTVGAAAFLRARFRDWSRLVFLCVAMAGAGILDLAMGFLVVRPAPPAAGTAASISVCGFQLGPTAISVFYGCIAYLIALSQSTWRAKVFPWSAAVFVAFLTGVARIYLAADWLTDIFTRWALALLWFSAVLVVMQIVEQPAGLGVTQPEEPQPGVSVAEDALPEASFAADGGRRETPVDGLRDAEVAERLRRGEVNAVKEQTSRTVPDILRANVFTRSCLAASSS
jgi:hypothetical protein